MFKRQSKKEKYLEIKSKIKALEKELEPLKKELMLDLENVSIFDRASIDSKLLKSLYPDVHRKVLKVYSVRKLKF